MGLRPLTGAAQTAADIKVALIPVVFLPVAGRLGQLPVRVEPGPVGVDPLAELLPAADEGFVGDLDIAGGLPRCAARRGFQSLRSHGAELRPRRASHGPRW